MLRVVPVYLFKAFIQLPILNQALGSSKFQNKIITYLQKNKIKSPSIAIKFSRANDKFPHISLIFMNENSGLKCLWIVLWTIYIPQR